MGKLKLFVLTVGLHPFFDNLMSALMLTISLSLRPGDCDMDILKWFLAEGVLMVLNHILMDVIERITEMAEEDGKISKKEFKLLETVRFFTFFVFLAELIIFLYVR